jgi:hypothetical protein
MMSDRNNDYERADIPVLWHSTGLSDRTRQNMRTQAKAWAKLPSPSGRQRRTSNADLSNEALGVSDDEAKSERQTPNAHDHHPLTA